MRITIQAGQPCHRLSVSLDLSVSHSLATDWKFFRGRLREYNGQVVFNTRTGDIMAYKFYKFKINHESKAEEEIVRIIQRMKNAFGSAGFSNHH